MALSFSDITLISSDETLLPVNPDSSTLVITGVMETPKANKINIYPNPASRFISIYSSESTDLEFIFNDVVGNVLFESSANDHRSLIDVSQFPEGIYFLQIKFVSGNTVKRVSIIR